MTYFLLLTTLLGLDIVLAGTSVKVSNLPIPDHLRGYRDVSYTITYRGSSRNSPGIIMVTDSKTDSMNYWPRCLYFSMMVMEAR